MSLIVNRQLRAARALLDWEQKDLAKAAGVAIGTIRRMESLDGAIRGHHDTVMKVQQALEAAGIQFLNHGAPGVRLCAQPRGTSDSSRGSTTSDRTLVTHRSDSGDATRGYPPDSGDTYK